MKMRRGLRYFRVDALFADSLDLVEYIMSPEQVFKLAISDEDVEKLTTVGETQVCLQLHLPG